MTKKYKWVVEFTVAKVWVEDGFNLTKDRAKEMLANDLQYANGSELSAKIIKAPSKKEIRKVQGYND